VAVWPAICDGIATADSNINTTLSFTNGALLVILVILNLAVGMPVLLVSRSCVLTNLLGTFIAAGEEAERDRDRRLRDIPATGVDSRGRQFVTSIQIRDRQVLHQGLSAICFIELQQNGNLNELALRLRVA